MKVLRDPKGNVWIEYPEDSGNYADMEYAISRVAEKFGTATIECIEAEGYAPMTEMVPKPDYVGWTHYDGCVVCPNPECQKWTPTDDNINSILAAISDHICKKPEPSGDLCFCDVGGDIPHIHKEDKGGNSWIATAHLI
jgi:hypothetical protein